MRPTPVANRVSPVKTEMTDDSSRISDEGVIKQQEPGVWPGVWRTLREELPKVRIW